MKQYIFVFVGLCLCLILFNPNNAISDDLSAKYQILDISPSTLQQKSGEPFMLTITYNVTDRNNKLLGLGVRFHFDSMTMSFIKATNLFNLLEEPVVQNDDADYDNNPSTDSYLLIGWFEWNSLWPGKILPCVLGQLEFKIKDNAILGTYEINTSFSTTNPNYEGKSNQVKVNIVQ